jgi:flotillin
VQKTVRDSERADAEARLATTKTSLNRDVEIARIMASRATEQRDEELKRDVELKRAAAEMERLRARDVVQATIAREAKQQAADAKAYEVAAAARADLERVTRATDATAYKTKVDAETQAAADFARNTRNTDAAAYKTKIDTETQAAAVARATDAAAYKTKVEAETQAAAEFARTTKHTDATAYKTKVGAEAQAAADFACMTKNADGAAYKTRADAEAWSHAAKKNAEANLVKKVKEAEGLSAMADAYGKLSQAFGGPAGLLTYMMIEKGTFVELAKANAQAVQGMQPKISVWNTGPQAGVEGQGQGQGQAGGVASLDTMRNVYQMLPPLMSTINEQTGITLPEWQFGRLAGEMSQVERKKLPEVNGKK